MQEDLPCHTTLFCWWNCCRAMWPSSPPVVFSSCRVHCGSLTSFMQRNAVHLTWALHHHHHHHHHYHHHHHHPLLGHRQALRRNDHPHPNLWSSFQRKRYMTLPFHSPRKLWYFCFCPAPCQGYFLLFSAWPTAWNLCSLCVAVCIVLTWTLTFHFWSYD